MAKLPIYLELQDKRVVVIGAGSVAIRKIPALYETGARIVVIAEHIDKKLESITDTNDIEVIESRYSKEYLIGASLVIAATNNHLINRRIYQDCQELEILCNVVDHPEFCDFFVPAVVKRGNLQIAVGTEGNCPAYAGHIRKKLERIFTEDHGRFLQELEKIRKLIIENIPDQNQRKALLGELVSDKSFDRFLKDGPQSWRDWTQKLTAQNQE